MNLTLLAIIIGVACGIVFLIKHQKALNNLTKLDGEGQVKDKEVKSEFGGVFRAKQRFFNTSEYAFFEVLNRVNDGKYFIFSKVRLEDIIEVAPTVDGKVAYGMRKRINSRHIDFVLVDKTTGKTKAAIEVDGLAHNGYKAAENDQKKNDLLAAVPEINFYRIRVGENFEDKIKEIFEKLV